MKLLTSLLSLVLVASLNAQEIDIKKDIQTSVDQINKSSQGKSDILYVLNLDDKQLELPYSNNILNGLQPEMIDELNVIKKGSSPEFKAYKDKNVDGVIVIKLKNDFESKRFFEALQEKASIEVLSIKQDDPDREVKVRFSDSPNAQPLIRVQLEGKSYTLDRKSYGLNEIDPNGIESIHVIKGEEALRLYDKEGKDGVIEIKLKDTRSNKKLFKKLEEAEKKKDKDKN